MTTPIRPDDPLGVADVLLVALRGKRWLLVASAVGLASGAASALLTPRRWTSTSVFSAQQRRGGSGSLSGLAAQFGLQVPVADGGASPALFADLVRSDDVLRPIVTGTDAEAQRGPDPVALRRLLDVDEADAERAAVLAMNRLAARITAVVNPKTQVVRVSVQLPDPRAALTVHERLLGALAELNQRARQTQASAERRFTASRLREVENDLRAAEAALRAFAERNRDVDNSPALRTEMGRLEREVSLRQQVVASLAQAVEQAKIEEVRDTPILSILQQPRQPAFPDGRGTVGRAVLGAVAGACLAMFWLALSRAMSSAPRDPNPREVLRNELRGLVARVGRRS